MKKIMTHLSPSDVKKQGTSYDAAMLLAVLQAMKKNPVEIPDKSYIIAALKTIPLTDTIMTIQCLEFSSKWYEIRFNKVKLIPIDSH